jgi:hypothetical protein
MTIERIGRARPPTQYRRRARPIRSIDPSTRGAPGQEEGGPAQDRRRRAAPGLEGQDRRPIDPLAVDLAGRAAEATGADASIDPPRRRPRAGRLRYPQLHVKGQLAQE